MLKIPRSLISSTVAVGVTRLGSVALGIAQSVLMARIFGAAAFGQWTLVITFASVLALVARFGLDLALTIRASHLLGAGETKNAQDAARASIGISVALSLLPTIAIFAAPDKLSSLLGDPSLQALLVGYCFSIPIGQITAILASWLRANAILTRSALLSDTAIGALQTSLLAYLWLGDVKLTISVFAVISVLLQILVMLAIIDLVRKSAPIPISIPSLETWKGLRPLAANLYVINLAGALSPWLVLWLLSVFEGADDVAHFVVSMRIATSAGLVFGVINYVVVPSMAERYGAGDVDGVRTRYNQSLLLSTACTFPLWAFIALFAAPLLSIWGSDFTASANLVLIMMVGELFNLLTGSCGYALAVTGNERQMQKITLRLFWIRTVLSIGLIPPFGIAGAAWVVATSTALENIAKSWVAWRKIGLLPFPLNLMDTRRS